MDQSFRAQVYDVVAQIPRGKVMTYSGVARAAGVPGAARAVGTAMRCNTDTDRVPCHRVVRADGSLGEYAYGGTEAKRTKLLVEGVAFVSETKVASESIIDSSA